MIADSKGLKKNTVSPRSSPERVSRGAEKSPLRAKEGVVCFYCKKRDHIVQNCFLLNLSPKTVNLIETSKPNDRETPDTAVPINTIFSPFIMKGNVSLTSTSEKIPVVILWDSAASQSLILNGVLPLSNDTYAGSDVLVQGFGMDFVGLPLHQISLECDLVNGPIVVGVKESLPVEGV